MTQTLPAAHALKLVLDTNVVLDWLVFSVPSVQALSERQAIQVTLLTHEPALIELQRVLNYPAFKLDHSRQQAIMARYRLLTTQPTLPDEFSLQNQQLPTDFPICKDPDDQHFLALAFHAHADALVTKDKALLALRKRARKFGVAIIRVEQLLPLLSPVTPSL